VRPRALAPAHYPHGSAIINTLQQVSGAAGIALFITLYTVASAAGGPIVDGHKVTVEVLKNERRAERAVKWWLNYYGARGSDCGVKCHRIRIVQPECDPETHLARVEIDARCRITNGERWLGVEDDCVRW